MKQAKIPMTQDEITKCIYNNFKYLLSLGFVYEEKWKVNEYNNEKYKIFYYSNIFLKLKLKFIFSDDFVEEAVLLFSILKNNENKAFSFEDYLKMKSIKNYKSFPEESSKDYIARIAQLFKQESEGDLKDVLNGKKWIDVPIDYMGYK